jgi:hypothetical protein
MERFPMDAETWAQVNTYAAGYLPMVDGDIVEAMRLGLLAYLRVVEAARSGEISVASPDDGLVATLELDEDEGLFLVFRPVQSSDDAEA